MGRKAKSNLPVSIRNTLNDQDSIHQALLQRQATQAANYNSHAGPQLANLYIGQRVCVQDHRDGTCAETDVLDYLVCVQRQKAIIIILVLRQRQQ